mmetsp:Transcript_9494/g.39037  ORF Transcript_9494/g.39037 Transcript_9494/m.39037 type:complete len:329 (+) Transcript_9494:666-1652(+)
MAGLPNRLPLSRFIAVSAASPEWNFTCAYRSGTTIRSFSIEPYRAKAALSCGSDAIEDLPCGKDTYTSRLMLTRSARGRSLRAGLAVAAADLARASFPARGSWGLAPAFRVGTLSTCLVFASCTASTIITLPELAATVSFGKDTASSFTAAVSCSSFTAGGGVGAGAGSSASISLGAATAQSFTWMGGFRSGFLRCAFDLFLAPLAGSLPACMAAATRFLGGLGASDAGGFATSKSARDGPASSSISWTYVASRQSLSSSNGLGHMSGSNCVGSRAMSWSTCSARLALAAGTRTRCVGSAAAGAFGLVAGDDRAAGFARSFLAALAAF